MLWRSRCIKCLSILPSKAVYATWLHASDCNIIHWQSPYDKSTPSTSVIATGRPDYHITGLLADAYCGWRPLKDYADHDLIVFHCLQDPTQICRGSEKCQLSKDGLYEQAPELFLGQNQLHETKRLGKDLLDETLSWCLSSNANFDCNCFQHIVLIVREGLTWSNN